MKIFYVAIYSNFEATNDLFRIKSDNELDAAKSALLLLAEKEGTRTSSWDEWVNSFKDMDDLKDQCSNADLVVSKVIMENQ